MLIKASGGQTNERSGEVNVASLELSKELYELSGWETGVWRSYAMVKRPAYDLGYLLRRLPGLSAERPLTIFSNGTTWLIGYSEYGSIVGVEAHSDTPEDAAAKLAIELFKQGVLKGAGDE